MEPRSPALCRWDLYHLKPIPCLSSVTHLCLTLGDPMDCNMSGSLSITKSWSLLKLMFIELWCHPTILSSVVPFSCLQSFPAWGSFPVNQFFESGGQSIGASASVHPTNIQDSFPLGLTGLISFQSKGLSRVFSNTTFQKHQFFSAILYLLVIYCLESPLEWVLQKRRIFVHPKCWVSRNGHGL